MTNTTKALLARLNAVDVVGKTLPAFVTKFDADCQWLNGNEVCNRRRQGIVHDCPYLLVLIVTGENETVEMCFERRDEANTVAKLAKSWGVTHAHVNQIHSRFESVHGYIDNRRRRQYRYPFYNGLGVCDLYDFARDEQIHAC